MRSGVPMFAQGFDLAGAAANGKIAVCIIDSRPDRNLRQGSARIARDLCDRRTKAQCTEPRIARRSAVRHRLCNRRQGRSEGEGDWHVSSFEPCPIVYPVALVAAWANPGAAFFLAYLTSEAATKIFLEQGFDVLSK
jgi:molybdate transport system substrate-binding protein